MSPGFQTPIWDRSYARRSMSASRSGCAIALPDIIGASRNRYRGNVTYKMSFQFQAANTIGYLHFSPSNWVMPLGLMGSKRRPLIIRRVAYHPMLDGVVMDVIQVSVQVVGIPYDVIPESPLPDRGRFYNLVFSLPTVRKT